MGAVSSGGVRVLNAVVVDSLGVTAEVIEQVAAREGREVERRELAYRQGRPAPEVHGKYVILVDDGVATGSTMRAAIAVLRELQAGHIVVAVPVAARESYLELRRLADEFVALLIPRDFGAVGQFYADFAQTGDAEVRHLLEANAAPPIGKRRN
jgi:predicted phosphoribosyltransferase